MDSKTTLGDAIRRRRKEAGLTQEELGTRAGYKAGAGVSISRIENGSVTPGPSKLSAIAVELGTTADALELEAGTQRDQAAPSIGRRQTLKLRRENVEERFLQRSDTLVRAEDDYYRSANEAIDTLVGPLLAISQQFEGAPSAAFESADVDDADLIGLLLRDITESDEGGAGNFLRGLGVHGAATAAGAEAPSRGGRFLAKKVLDLAAEHGTSGTGVPINTLEGAARTRAALARLGLGTKAAGGFGIRGGRLALGAVAALPRVIAVGGVFALAKWSDRQELERKLTEAERFLALSEERFQAVIKHMTESAKILQTAITHGVWALEAWNESLVSPAGGSQRSWKGLDDSQQAKFTELVHVATCIGALLALRPIELLTAQSADLPTIDKLTFGDPQRTRGQDCAATAQQTARGLEGQTTRIVTFELTERQFQEIREYARIGIRSALGRRG